MKKFEIGKRYYESGLTFEITNKTAKTITYKVIQHAGRYNERVVKEGRGLPVRSSWTTTVEQ